MDKEKIKEQTGINKVIFKKEVTSTNDEILNEKQDDTLMIAFFQSKGKGRYGRKFFSPENGLYFSYLVNEEMTFQQSQFITPIMGIAVSYAIDEVFDVNTSIKWVNDILLEKKKICGILTECKVEKNICHDIVVGVGINVYKSDFPEDIKDTAGFIEEKDDTDKREDLVIKIMQKFERFWSEDRDSLVEKYRRKATFIDNEIKVHKNGDYVKAVAMNINDDFSLKVKYDNGTIEDLNIGEIFL
ncbi:biotin--[acetyl-CoA-carboxylase] ligase [Finegoldia magna]|uniref:biotin--[acetyl-CoA-carboxylase] ligase n=1 Tax=Finegoldia magna TaxID=1260 RepID=UPI0026F04762|nr:biotin--[acetyl-CoA-carboxylase] ligase [Finegoldia magna]